MKNGSKMVIFLALVTVALSTAVGGVSLTTSAISVSPKSTTTVITDFIGRKNSIPTNVTRISVIHPIPCQMVWRLAPKKLVSVDKQFDERIELMTSAEQARIMALPVTGEFHSNLSAEQILAVNPQVVISLSKDAEIDTEQKSYNIPVVAASKNSLGDIAKSWQFIGKIVGNQKEGNSLYKYWTVTTAMVTKQTSKISTNKKLKVYYAQSTVTNTVGVDTVMSSIIKLAGGTSYAAANNCGSSTAASESVALSMESIVKWNPDVIIAASQTAKNQIMSGSAWANISAVKNKRVYASRKYEMLDRIQSLMGLLWTAKTLYPKNVKLDLNKEVKNFYSKVYLYSNMSNKQITKLID